ncbi:MAG TPA: hypothetical protein VK935_01910 [Actinomycetospora sp.]|nr:hypothetical protein [Actinomycetospora sp.]
MRLAEGTRIEVLTAVQGG